MFTYKWNKGFFYILMGDVIIEHLIKSDGEHLLKNDVLFLDHFQIEIENGNVFFSSVEKDFEFFFVDKDGVFLSSIKEFLTGGVE